jgi:hypothetical protein
MAAAGHDVQAGVRNAPGHDAAVDQRAIGSTPPASTSVGWGSQGYVVMWWCGRTG